MLSSKVKSLSDSWAENLTGKAANRRTTAILQKLLSFLQSLFELIYLLLD